MSRCTFIATKDPVANKLTLFKDVVHHDGKTTSTTVSRTLRNSPVRYITTSGASQTSVIGDVIAVCQNGEVLCLSGETLEIRWTSPAKSAVQDASSLPVDDFELDFVTSGTVTELSEGIFKSRPELRIGLPKTANVDPTLLVLVSRSASQGKERRHFIILAVAAGSSDTTSELQRLTPLDVAPIPSTEEQEAGKAEYQFEAQTGTLLQLQQGALSVYDLTSAVPKLRSIMPMNGAVAFSRLSRPFIMSCSLDSVGLYNYQYRSVHAKAPLDLSDILPEKQEAHSCRLICYLRSQELVVALIDNVLACIHVEPPQSNGKRRKAGLLIDSIGRGTAVEVPVKKVKLDHSSSEFAHKVPGTITESYLAEHHADIEAADDLLRNDEVLKWEEAMRTAFRINQSPATQAENGEEVPGWEWFPEPSSYPAVDRRWVTYAISRVFTTEAAEEEDAPLKLRLALPDCNVTTYLAHAGHLTLSNIQSAFRDELEANPPDAKRLASDLVLSLTEADPSMELLQHYLRATKLGEVEVLLAVRALMLSMDLIPDTAKTDTKKLLTLEPHQDTGKDDMDLDDLERAIAVTEHYLGDESSSRSRSLTLAFMKLWRLPTRSTVKALRTTLQTEEIISLIQMLRMELVRGAWTSLYIDPTSFDADANEPPPDGAIAIISDLLGRCLDAVGAGGWLLNDAVSDMDAADTGDFLTALKLEVTAALEGIEEAIVLNGYVGESVRFGMAAQKGTMARPSWNTNKPIPVHLEGRESRLLPLGLKTKQLPSREKVVGGGEVVQRSMREAGHLISQKVEAYSLEKLAV